MPTVTAQADILFDWRGLIRATDLNPEVLPIVQSERDALEQFLGEFETLKGRQEELKALRQEATQKINTIVVQGKELAIRIRSVVRGKIGPKNERLVHFNVAPIRKRPRKPVKPPDEEPSGNEPGASVSPSTKPVA